ncbi:YolD-like family protein [Bacillus altitudinis]|uniref:YolD-like family protein n=1 Tax=Bacillus altitudinis TaxID=293387 RepID=UPI002F9259FF
MQRGFAKKWGTRLMLPEHKALLNQLKEKMDQEEKVPDIDEQQMEHINYALNAALHYKTAVRIEIFKDQKRSCLKGFVTAIDYQQKMIYINTKEKESEHIKIDTNSILDVYTID